MSATGVMLAGIASVQSRGLLDFPDPLGLAGHFGDENLVS
jgi:hypothetical protein